MTAVAEVIAKDTLSARALDVFRKEEADKIADAARSRDADNLELGRQARKLTEEILGLPANTLLTFSRVEIEKHEVDFHHDGMTFRVVDRYPDEGMWVCDLFLVDHYEDTGREYLRRITDLYDLGVILAGDSTPEPVPPSPRPVDHVADLAEELGVIPGQAPGWFLEYQIRVSKSVGKVHERINDVVNRLDRSEFPK